MLPSFVRRSERRPVAPSRVRILAYCLMSNHIHLVAVPAEAESLALCLQRVHGRYAQYLNARRQRCGHLWQNRFFSCPVDERHLWTALRYVELNPARAGMVGQTREYPWSSTAAHLGGRDASRALDLESIARSNPTAFEAVCFEPPDF